MVGIHILKHHYNCSDERVVEEIHETANWQCFCGFSCFQRGQILVDTTLVKFRDRIGVEGRLAGVRPGPVACQTGRLLSILAEGSVQAPRSPADRAPR